MKLLFTKKLLLTSFFTLLSMVPYSMFSQIIIDENMTPEELVEDILVGDGIDVFNIEFNAPNVRYGYFDSQNSNVGMDEGIMLATKNTQIANCGVGTDGSGPGNDPDLEILEPNFTLNDVTILEFDFIPSGNEVEFRFVFASREYHGFTCSNYNDVFGLFISGPGINGPFSNNGENIATLPDGTIVSINTVNNGGTTCPANTEFFVDNGGGNGANAPPDICFGGFTVPLTASSPVQCGEVYHLKFAIANAADGALDSGVFLEGGSLVSSGVNVDISAVATVYYGEDYDGEVIVEGCTDANVILTNNSEEDVDVEFIFDGSAENGVHFEALPEEVTVPVGETHEFDITPIVGSTDGVDSLILGIISIDPCTEETDTTFATFYFLENVPINTFPSDTLFNCPIDGFVLDVNAEGGVGELSYEWTENDPNGNSFSTDETPTVLIEESTDYYVTITDSCGFSTDASISVNMDIIAIYDLNVSEDTTICINGTAEIWAEVLNPPAGTDFTYNWIDENFNGPGIHEVEFNGENELTFTVFAQDDDLCVSDTLTITINEHPELELDLSQDQFICEGNSVNLVAGATGGLYPYNYTWTDPDNEQTNDSTLFIETAAGGTYCMEVEDACETPNVSDCIEVTLYPTPEINFSTNIPQPACYPVEVEFTNLTNPDELIESITWTFGNGQSFFSDNPDDFDSIAHVYSQPGYFDVTLEITTVNGCVEERYKPMEVWIFDYPNAMFDFEPRPATITNTRVTFENHSQDNSYNQWTFGENGELGSSANEEPIFTFPPDVVGEYPVELIVTNNFGCTDTFVQVVHVHEEFLIYVPNAFTPNGDGVNDFFKAEGVDILLREFTMTIYNRWGDLVFETTNPKQGWDGKHHGKDAPQGTYVYKIVTRSETKNEKHEIVGHVNLLR